MYLCHDEFAGRDVAVKIVYQERAQRPAGRQALPQAVRHRGLARRQARAPAHRADLRRGGGRQAVLHRRWSTSHGGTLEPFCAPEELLPLDKIVEIVFKCTRALDFAHKLGVTHRDIKPANILLRRRDRHQDHRLRLGDHARAATPRRSPAIGSPAYMSPQQVKEQPLDHRTDIYSLGVVMYQLLAGVLPFQATNNFSMIYQITNVEPPPPSSLPPGDPGARSTRIVQQARWRRTSARRYQTWDEFSLDLAEVFRERGPGRPQPRSSPTRRSSRRCARLAFFAEFTDAELWEVLRISLAGRARRASAHAATASPATSSASSPRAR